MHSNNMFLAVQKRFFFICKIISIFFVDRCPSDFWRKAQKPALSNVASSVLHILSETQEEGQKGSSVGQKNIASSLCNAKEKKEGGFFYPPQEKKELGE